MAKITDRGPSPTSKYSAADGAAFLERSNGSHTIEWKADAYRFTTGGAATLQWADVPIVGGQLKLDGSDMIRRRLTLEIGGGEELAAKSYNDPLVPFGQWLILYFRIDRQESGWFPWVKAGEYHVVTYSFERPAQIATVEAVDWSGRVEEYLHTHKTSYKGKTAKNAIVAMCENAVPDKAFGVTVQAGDRANDKLGGVNFDTGTGRWTACNTIADSKGMDVFFDCWGNLVLRNAISGADDDIVPQTGPDIGSASNPVAAIAEGKNLVALTSTITRQGGANRVRYNLSGTVTRRDKKQNKKKKGIETHEAKWKPRHVESDTNSGPARWGGQFGFLPIAEDINLESVETGEVAAWNRRADSVLSRRRGLISFRDMDMIGGWHLEPDDKVAVTMGGITEAHYVQSVIFDIAGHTATRIRTRQLAVTDPGEGA